MSPLHVAVIVHFDVSHLLTERSSHPGWSIMFSKITQNSQENTCAGVPTYHFNSQSMGRPDKRRSSHCKCSVKEGIVKNLANFTGKHLCWTMKL